MVHQTLQARKSKSKMKAAETKTIRRHPRQASGPKASTQTTDSKGRVVLSQKFANRSVIVEEISDTEVVVKLARVIPKSKSWLYENPPALASVQRGLAQARAGRLVSGPDLEGDAALVAKLKD
jgi:hypothetical protein